MLQLYTEKEMVSRLVAMFEKERIAQNLTQKELAELSGIPLPTYRSFVKHGKLSVENMFKLLFVLQLDEKGENLIKERAIKTLEEIRVNALQQDRKRVRK
jgi:transcriptional regulator with XRE-family HTH domain